MSAKYKVGGIITQELIDDLSRKEPAAAAEGRLGSQYEAGSTPAPAVAAAPHEKIQPALIGNGHPLSCVCTLCAGAAQEGTPETDAFYASLYSRRIPKEMLDAVIGDEKAFAEGLERRLRAKKDEFEQFKVDGGKAIQWHKDRAEAAERERDELKVDIERGMKAHAEEINHRIEAESEREKAQRDLVILHADLNALKAAMESDSAELNRLRTMYAEATAIQGDKEVLKYVTSGNAVPVTLCTVSADLIRQLVEARASLESARGELPAIAKDFMAGTVNAHSWVVDSKAYSQLRQAATAATASRDARIKVLSDALLEAASDIEDRGGYAMPYFQKKHGLAESVKKYRDIASASTCEGEKK